MSTINIDYGHLASYVTISNLHKKTDTSFYKTMKKAYDFKDVNGKHSPIINKKFWDIVNNNICMFVIYLLFLILISGVYRVLMKCSHNILLLLFWSDLVALKRADLSCWLM